MNKICAIVVALTMLVSTKVVSAASRNEEATAGQWTLKDTVSAAINYAPSVKREQEGVRMAEENMRRAQAGHLPRVDVQASTGTSTLPVSKYD